VALVAGEDPGWGGIGTYTGILGRGLAELGHEVTLVLRGWEDDGPQTLAGLAVQRVVVPEPEWRRGTVALVSRLYASREALAFSARVAGVLARLAPDVVEAPEFGAPALVASLRGLLQRAGSGSRSGSRPRLRSRSWSGSRVVVRLHAPSFLTARLAAEPVELDGRLQEVLEAGAARLASAVTAPSSALADVVARRWPIPRRRIQVVPNPVDEELFVPPREPPVPGRVLIAGRVERGKGHDVLLEALPAIRAAVPSAHVVAVGADGGLLEPLRRRAAALGLAEAFMFLGARPRDELPSLYGSATVCTVPSRFDAFPYTAVEAMACGRAVVASRVGGLPEVMEEADSGVLVAPEDPGALADAIVGLLLDPSRRSAIEAAARRRVIDRFASRTVASRMADLYAQLR
jgi:glycosyltransferase involved in cell wall biosynthesis